MFTMGDIARQALEDDSILYRLFGVDAEILIDHAFGYEPCTMKDIKAYRSEQKSISIGQVLSEPYEFEKARIIVREMAEALALDLFQKRLLASSVTLVICYDRQGVEGSGYTGEIVNDGWGRMVPRPVGGTVGLGHHTNSAHLIAESLLAAYDKCVDSSLFVRRVNLAAGGLLPVEAEQPSLFDEEVSEVRESHLQEARLGIIRRFGKNALYKGTDMQEGATALERNRQIGGHRA
jgi:DNA polymerase V